MNKITEKISELERRCWIAERALEFISKQYPLRVICDSRDQAKIEWEEIQNCPDFWKMKKDTLVVLAKDDLDKDWFEYGQPTQDINEATDIYDTALTAYNYVVLVKVVIGCYGEN